MKDESYFEVIKQIAAEISERNQVPFFRRLMSRMQENTDQIDHKTSPELYRTIYTSNLFAILGHKQPPDKSGWYYEDTYYPCWEDESLNFFCVWFSEYSDADLVAMETDSKAWIRTSYKEMADDLEKRIPMFGKGGYGFGYGPGLPKSKKARRIKLFQIKKKRIREMLVWAEKAGIIQIRGPITKALLIRFNVQRVMNAVEQAYVKSIRETADKAPLYCRANAE